MIRHRHIARLPGRTARQPAIGQKSELGDQASVDAQAMHDDVGGYMLAPPRKQPTRQALAPSYIWNSTTQELIPILPEDHPDYRENREIVTEAMRRWNNGENKSE